jgi:hypothetical protein
MKHNRAFLEQLNGEWLDDFVYISKERLKDMDFEVIPFDGDDIENTLSCYVLDISKDIIIGSVESTTVFFKECGVEVPEYLGYPKQLREFLGRDIREHQFNYLYNLDTPFFIKPSKGVKKFTGCLIDNVKSLQMISEFYDVKDNDGIFVSDKVEFVSEYRCFVHEEELKGIKHYSGDFKVFPNVDIIEKMIESYTEANCAYTLDVGVDKEGNTLLVEVNDMWAIGSYGFDARTYVLMCVRRMFEIGRQNNGEKTPLWKKIRRD